MELPKTVAGLTPSPDNPRRISKQALADLSRSLREFGDLGSIVFNRQTGHLVGGHQRSSALPTNAQIHWIDETKGVIRHNGEEVFVRAVDWDLEKERRALILANNPNLQGEWDQEKLAELLTEVDFEAAGFSTMDIESAFTDEQIAGIIGRASVLDEGQESDEVKDAVAGLEAMGGKRKERGKKDEPQFGPEGKPLPEDSFKDSIGSQARRKARVEQPDANYTRTIVFRSDKHAEQFMRFAGYPPEQRYLDGAYLLRLLRGEPSPEGEGSHAEEAVRREGEGEAEAEGREGEVTERE